jgi:antitoxin YefM
MMQTVYRLNANELDSQFLEALKLLFRDKTVEIVVTTLDETDYLIKSEANYKRLKEAIDNVNKGTNLVTVDLDALA